MPLILRSAKGSPLLNDEIDDNFVYLDGKADTAQQAAEEAQGEAESAGEALSTHKGSGDHDARYLRKDVTQSAPLLTGIPQSGVVDLPYDLAQLRVALNTLMYPDGLIPSADFIFGGGQKTLDPRIVFTRNTPATYWEGGVLKTAAAGVPVFEDGAWRLEPGVTNLITHSTTPVAWTANGNVSFEDGGPGPKPSIQAVKVVSGSDSTYAAIAHGAISWDTNLTRTVVLKKGTWRYLGVSGRRRDGGAVTVDMDTGTVVSAAESFLSPRSSKIGEWVIVSYQVSSYNSGFSNGVVVQFMSGPNQTVQNPISAGETFYFGWAQAETTTYPTSLIETSGSAVTRGADTATITGDDFASIWGASEGAFYVDYESYVSSDSSYGEFVIGTDSDLVPGWGVFRSAATIGVDYRTAPGDGTQIRTVAAPVGSRNKLLIAWTPQQTQAFVKDAAWTPFENRSGDIDWSQITKFFIRTYGGLIRIYDMRFYKERPSNSQCEALIS